MEKFRQSTAPRERRRPFWKCGALMLTFILAGDFSSTLSASEIGDTADPDSPVYRYDSEVKRRLKACTSTPYVFEFKGIPLSSAQKCLKKHKVINCAPISTTPAPKGIKVCYLENQRDDTPFDTLANKTVFPQFHYLDDQLYLIKLTLAEPTDIDPVADYLTKIHGAPHAVDRNILELQNPTTHAKMQIEQFILVWQRGHTQIEVKTFNENDRTATIFFYDQNLLSAAEHRIKNAAQVTSD